MDDENKQREIISKILEATQHINKVARYGSGDYVIVSSEYGKLIDEQIKLMESEEIDSKIRNILK